MGLIGFYIAQGYKIAYMALLGPFWPVGILLKRYNEVILPGSSWQRTRTPGPRGGQPGPLKSLIRPHRPLGRLPGASQVLFCRISCQISVRNLYRGEGVLLAGSKFFRILAAPDSILVCCFWVPKRFPKILPKIPPKYFQKTTEIVQTYFLCDLSVISFSTTLGSTFKLDHYSI